MATRDEQLTSVLARLDTLTAQVKVLSSGSTTNSSSSTTSVPTVGTPQYAASSEIAPTDRQVGVIFEDEYEAIGLRDLIKGTDHEHPESGQKGEKTSSGETVIPAPKMVSVEASTSLPSEVPKSQASQDSPASTVITQSLASPSSTTYSLSPAARLGQPSSPGTPDAFSPYHASEVKEWKGLENSPGAPNSGLGFMPYGNALPFNFPPRSQLNLSDGVQGQGQGHLGGASRNLFPGGENHPGSFQPQLTQSPFQGPPYLSPLIQGGGLSNPNVPPMNFYGGSPHLSLPQFQSPQLGLGWNGPGVRGLNPTPLPRMHHFSPAFSTSQPPPSPGLVHEGLHFPNVGRALGLERDEREDLNFSKDQSQGDEGEGASGGDSHKGHGRTSSDRSMNEGESFPIFPMDSSILPSLPIPSSFSNLSGGKEPAFNNSSRPNSQSGGEDSFGGGSSRPSSIYSSQSRGTPEKAQLGPRSSLQSLKSMTPGTLSGAGGSINIPSLASGRAPVPSFFPSSIQQVPGSQSPDPYQYHSRSSSQGNQFQPSPGTVPVNRAALNRATSYGIGLASPSSSVGIGNPSSGSMVQSSQGVPTPTSSALRQRSLPQMNQLATTPQIQLPSPRGSSAPEISFGPSDADTLVQRALASRSPEASINLQQQLKNASADRRESILKAIAPHLVPLSHDKHGNFLVQRAIGVDPEITLHLKNHFVPLSLNQFGCHVVQRVLDEDENKKIMVVEEMLGRDLAITLTSRNSIHVWQKILEASFGSQWNLTISFGN